MKEHTQQAKARLNFRLTFLSFKNSNHWFCKRII